MNISSKRGRHKRAPIPESALRGFKYFKVLSSILRRLHLEKGHHNRKLYFDQYVALFLFYFFNPIVTSLRAIQQVSGLKKVQKVLGLRRTSLGSLSEASSVFDSGLITPITETDRLAGVQRDMIVRLGSPKCQDDLSSSVRVIEIYHRDSCRQAAQVKGFF